MPLHPDGMYGCRHSVVKVPDFHDDIILILSSVSDTHWAFLEGSLIKNNSIVERAFELDCFNKIEINVIELRLSLSMECIAISM